MRQVPAERVVENGDSNSNSNCSPLAAADLPPLLTIYLRRINNNMLKMLKMRVHNRSN